MRTLPPTTELFPQEQFINRHPSILFKSRLQWAVRNRHSNGLAEAAAVFESKGGEVLIHEPSFLRWYLCLDGRAKPRARRLVARLSRVKPVGPDKWAAACPLCESRSGRPISIRALPDGRVLVHPFCCCDTGDVLRAVGLKLSDLYPKTPWRVQT